MKSFWKVSCFAFLLLGSALTIAAGGEPADASDSSASQAIAASTLDGVFTMEQADRGKVVYTSHCESCHGDSLRGGIGGGPPLAGNFFFNRWGDSPLLGLYEYTRARMPMGYAGSLSAAEYIDVVAYILSANELPVGDSELAADSEALAELILERSED